MRLITPNWIAILLGSNREVAKALQKREASEE
jgi:hypothetical protein